MAESEPPFSRRFGYQGADPAITVREEAPKWLRDWLPQVAEELGMTPSDMRRITRRVLPEAPEVQINGPILEVLRLLGDCAWYRVYDVAEAIHAKLDLALGHRPGEGPAAEYEERLNKLFRDRGVGWQMRAGRIEFRGSEPFEVVTREASDTLAGHGRQTAAREVHEALRGPVAPAWAGPVRRHPPRDGGAGVRGAGGIGRGRRHVGPDD